MIQQVIQSATQFPYLHQRNGIYYFRFKILNRHKIVFPKSEIRVSLRTDSLKLAQVRVAQKLTTIHQIKEVMTMDKHLLKSLYLELSDFSDIDHLGSYERKAYADGVDSVAGDIRFSLQEGAGFDLSDTQIKAKPQREASRDYLSLLLSLLELRSERAFSGLSPQFLAKDEEVKALLNHLTAEPEEVEEQLLLSEAWDMFVKFKTSSTQKNPWSEKAQQNNLRLFNNMLTIIGDKPVQSITKRDIKGCLATLAQFPLRNKKPYNDMALEEILGDLDSTPEEDLVSSKWVVEHLKIMQSLFSAYLKKEMDILEKTPTEDVKWDSESNPYAVFTNSEVRQLEAEAITLEGFKKWTILLAIYTGCRRSEIFRITKEAFHTDEESGLVYFSIGVAKTPAGVRRIPVHQKLIEYGFLEYVNTIESGAIFPELSTEKPISNNFTRIMDRLDIPVIDEVEGFKKVFHSFRHTFTSKAREKGNEKTLVQVVIGHKGIQDITDRYTHISNYAIKTLADVVNSVEFG